MESSDASNPHHTHAPGLREPHWLLTRLIPLLVYPGLIACIFVAHDFWVMMKDKEGGIEWLSVLCLLTGVGFGIRMLVSYGSALPRKWLIGWFALACAGMFVLAGEEMSWGQHLGFWDGEDLPEPLRELNDQNESNFHNMTNALDQGPTNLVVLGTFFAFVILPILLKRKKRTFTPDEPAYWFWPTRAGLFAAIGVLIIPFPKRIYEWVTGQDGPWDWRHSEIHEFYIALLMTTYIVSVHHRLRDYARHGAPEGHSPERKPAEPAEPAGRTED